MKLYEKRVSVVKLNNNGLKFKIIVRTESWWISVVKNTNFFVYHQIPITILTIKGAVLKLNISLRKYKI